MNSLEARPVTRSSSKSLSTRRTSGCSLCMARSARVLQYQIEYRSLAGKVIFTNFTTRMTWSDRFLCLCFSLSLCFGSKETSKQQAPYAGRCITYNFTVQHKAISAQSSEAMLFTLMGTNDYTWEHIKHVMEHITTKAMWTMTTVRPLTTTRAWATTAATTATTYKNLRHFTGTV